MNSICTDCHYIGKSQQSRKSNYKLPLSGFLLGFSALTVIMYRSDKFTHDELYVSVILFLLFFLPGLYLLYNYLKSQKLPRNISSKNSSWLCLILAIILILWGTIVILDSLLAQHYFRVLTALIWIIFGILTIYYYYIDSITCPNCSERKTMIPIDYPRARSIIKENNLSVPE